MRLADFKVLGKVESVARSTMWKVEGKQDGICATYALTEIPVASLKQKAQETAVQDMRMLSKLEYKHVLKHYDAFVEKEQLFVMTSYAAGGTLSQWIATKGPGGLPEQTVWRFMIQLLLALRSIHAHSTVHRDIRPENIFLDQSGSIVVGNFGVSRLHSLSEGDIPAQAAGAGLYMSPELFSGSKCDEKSDMWALGVVLYECCTGKKPFTATSMPALASQILQCKPPPISREPYSDNLRSTIALLLSVDVSSRPSPQALLDLPCVRQHAAQLCIQVEDDGSQSRSVTRSLSQADECPRTDSRASLVSSSNCRDAPQMKQNNLRKVQAISPSKHKPSALLVTREPSKGSHANRLQSDARLKAAQPKTGHASRASRSHEKKVPSDSLSITEEDEATQLQGHAVEHGGTVMPLVAVLPYRGVTHGEGSVTDEETAWSVDEDTAAHLESLHVQNRKAADSGNLQGVSTSGEASGMHGSAHNNLGNRESYPKKACAGTFPTTRAPGAAGAAGGQHISDERVNRKRSTTIDERSGLERACV